MHTFCLNVLPLKHAQYNTKITDALFTHSLTPPLSLVWGLGEGVYQNPTVVLSIPRALQSLIAAPFPPSGVSVGHVPTALMSVF